MLREDMDSADAVMSEIQLLMSSMAGSTMRPDGALLRAAELLVLSTSRQAVRAALQEAAILHPRAHADATALAKLLVVSPTTPLEPTK